MNYGMLWFDNDPKTDLPQKVQRAAAYYRKKYGQAPNVCMVNPNMVKGEKPKSEEVEIKASDAILPHHLWIGVAAAKKAKGKG